MILAAARRLPLGLDNVVLSPHLGYVTEETYRVFYEGTVENLRAFLGGVPVRVLNPPPPGRP